jgi:Mitochondrial small ribosomal subunit Rsm22
MLGLSLVRPLEEDWRDALDSAARRRDWPTSHEADRLGARVGELSRAYNDASLARARTQAAGAARLGFAFARDVPKGAAAVRELVAMGLLAFGGTPLRILDVGAGLGATTWGVVRALEAATGAARPPPSSSGPVVDATWVDPDAQALDLGRELVRDRAARSVTSLRVTTLARSVARSGVLDGLARFDVVLVGHLLSELDVGAPAGERVGRHAALLEGLLEHHVEEHGALVLIEPALRDRTRHLHRVRDALVAAGATVFAPCLHAGPCPSLARESDWCHEDLPVDLPRWLAPVARAAGLRHEGLTFSYLVLRKDSARLGDALQAPFGAVRLRVVSELMRSKGKREAFVCGELRGGGSSGSAPVAARIRAIRLDRDASDFNAAWERLNRGDVVALDSALPLERPRIGSTARVRRLGDVESR